MKKSLFSLFIFTLFTPLGLFAQNSEIPEVFMRFHENVYGEQEDVQDTWNMNLFGPETQSNFLEMQAECDQYSNNSGTYEDCVTSMVNNPTGGDYNPSNSGSEQEPYELDEITVTYGDNQGGNDDFMRDNQTNTGYGGLVPCNGPDCGWEDLIRLLNNILNWLVAFLSVIATILLVFAGFKLVTSRGNVQSWQSAKNMFTNVVIGIVLVLTAWLIVNQLLSMLTGEGINDKLNIDEEQAPD